MKEEAAARAAQLLRRHRVAALGTVHDGAPSVTMTPYALVADPLALVVLVSGLASHTKDMRASGRVGVLVAEAEVDDQPVHALARISVQGGARELARDDPLHDNGTPGVRRALSRHDATVRARRFRAVRDRT